MNSSNNNSPHNPFLLLLEQIGDVVGAEPDVEKVLEETVQLIQSILEVPRCSIMLLDPDGAVLRMTAAAGIPKAVWPEIQIEVGKGFSGKVAQSGEALLVRDIEQEAGGQPNTQARYQTNSFICAPLKRHGKVIGVINVNDKKSGAPFNEQDLTTISALSNFITLSLENAHLLLEARRTRENLRNVFDELYVGLVTITPDGVIKHINRYAGQLLGLPAGVYLNLELELTLDGEMLNTVKALLQSTLQHRAPQSRRTVCYCKNRKQSLPLVVSTAIIQREDRAIESVIFIVEDRSLQREVKKLRKLDEVKNNFIAMVSHELRTPLTSIKGAAHILGTAMNEGFNDGQNKMLRVICQNTERLITQINNMLDVTYIETRTVQLARRPANLPDLINAIRPKFERLALERQLTLEFHYEQDTIFADVDIDKFTKIIENLLDNSLKFTQKGGRIRVTVGIEQEHCDIRVRDTGIGIPRNARQNIFDKFSQADQSSTREFGGSGLGLYITRAFVELHGGKISVLDINGAGTEFRVTLPRYVDSGAAEDAPVPAECSKSSKC